MEILYLCNGQKCAGVDCKGARLNTIETPQLYLDNKKQDRWYSYCCHTLNVDYAKNGPIKGPIDLIKRFKISLRPHFYLEEKRMKEEKVIGKLYLFKLCDDGTVERRKLNLIGKNMGYYVTRDVATNKKNSYAIEDLKVYKSHRVLLDTDDMALAKDIMVKALFKRMLDAQTKATIALDNYTNFREVNR